MKSSMALLSHMLASIERQVSNMEALTPIAVISIFTLSVFVGFEVVSKVSSTLHTPLMSGANAIHGVILVGAIIVASHSDTTLELTLSVIAIVLATINMIGGFVVTDRMLEMFKGKKGGAKGATSFMTSSASPLSSSLFLLSKVFRIHALHVAEISLAQLVRVLRPSLSSSTEISETSGGSWVQSL